MLGLMVILVIDLNINSKTIKLLGYIIGQSLDLMVGKDFNISTNYTENIYMIFQSFYGLL